MHAMRNGDVGQTVEEAKAEADRHVREYLMRAKDELKKGNTYEAYYLLGIGLHALQDATSPSHSGFQPWSDYTNFAGSGNRLVESARAHVIREILYPGKNSSLQMVTNQYLDWFESNSTELPAANLFDLIPGD